LNPCADGTVPCSDNCYDAGLSVDGDIVGIQKPSERDC
jgi:hypothetical protein